MKKIASIVAIASSLVATSFGNVALAENTSSLPDLLGHWTFEAGEELVEKTGNWGTLTLMGDDANIWDGELHVTGGDAAWAYARDYQGPTIREKTLISWVNLNLLDVGSGSVLTIDGINEDNFDGIVYGERVPQRWMAGSSFFLRTQDVMAVDETRRDLLQLAISYKDVGNNQVEITLCHDGVQIGQYTSDHMAQWQEGDAEVIFGKRHTPSGIDGPGEVEARIEEARIYGGSMTCAQVAALDTTDTEATAESDTGTGVLNIGDRVVLAYESEHLETRLDGFDGDFYEFTAYKSDCTPIIGVLPINGFISIGDADERGLNVQANVDECQIQVGDLVAIEDGSEYIQARVDALTDSGMYEFTSFTSDCTPVAGIYFLKDAISLEYADTLGLTVQNNWGCSEEPIQASNELLSAASGTSISKNERLYSPNGDFYLMLQDDGNLVLRREDGLFIWGLPGVDSSNSQIGFNANGNFCVTNNSLVEAWCTSTSGSDNILTLDDDAYLRIVNGQGQELWKSTHENNPFL